MSRLDYQAKIEYLALKQLSPSTDNDKIHTQDQIDNLALLIKEFGFDQPIVADEAGEIIKGVGRWLAAKQIGLTLVPVIIRDDMTKVERVAARLSDNHVSSLDYDDSKTIKGIKTLQDLGMDIKLAGLPAKSLAKVEGHIRSLTKKPTDPKDESEPEPVPDTISNAGDVWLLGKHRLEVGKGDMGQCDIMVKAWEEYTKQKAQRHSDPITRKAESK